MAVLALVLAGYLLMCAWVSSSSRIMPNISVGGVDLSRMTEEEARTALLNMAADTDVVALETSGGTTYLKGNCFQVDADALIQEAMASGDGAFLTAGYRYVSHMLGSSRMELGSVTLTAQGRAELDRCLDAVDTAGGAGDIPSDSAGEDDGVSADFLSMTEGGPEDPEASSSSSRDGDREYTEDLETGVLTFTKGVTRVAVDREAAEEAVISAFGEFDGTEPVSVVLEEEVLPPEVPDFEKIRDEIYVEVVDDHLSEDKMEIINGTFGVDMDVEAARAAYEAAEEGETYTVPLIMTKPRETDEEPVEPVFPDLLGEGTTKVSGSANRRHNVELSAQAIDGKILRSGQVFSYNNTTGSRSKANGYLEAPIYQGSKSSTDYGGGTCQVSSTLYYAVLHTELEVVERHNHGFNTGYVELGMDATVYFGVQDFQFRNSLDRPIKITASYYPSNGANYLTVRIYGTNTSGRYAVPESEKYDKVEPTTAYSPKEDVPRGTLVLDREQYAYTGWTAHTYRNIYEEDGSLVKKQDMGVSVYRMRPNTYFYNPLDGNPENWAGGKPGTGQTDEPEDTEPEPEEQKPQEQKPEEQKPAEQKPEEQKPAEQKPQEQKPAEQKPEPQQPAEPEPEPQQPVEPEPSEPEDPGTESQDPGTQEDPGTDVQPEEPDPGTQPENPDDGEGLGGSGEDA